MKILVDKKELEVKDGANGMDVALLLNPENKKKALAYKLDGKDYDLFHPLEKGGKVFELITVDSPEAFHILNHSTSHLMAQAIHALWPDALFTIGPAIDDGFYYDVDFKDYVLKQEDLAKIEAKMKEFSKKNEYIVREVVSKEKALELFKNNPYKEELIKELDGEISIYKQGEWFDLCLGVHVPSTGYIKNFKLETLAGAYWRGDSKNKQLTRIYGVSCFTKEDLDKRLLMKEEAKKRDHRKIGKDMGLFMISEYGPGFPFWLPNGWTLRRNIEAWWYDLQDKYGYKVISTPIILSKELWITSGHWDHYKENMYTTKIDDKEYAIKPMNCPGSILVYNSGIHSYKDLPIRLAEMGLVHRHEASGALNGLFRVRCFTQDDAHIYCREDQLESEIKTLIGLYDYCYSLFGLDYRIELSTRPTEGYIGSIDLWNKSEAILKEACEASGKEFKINPGDGAFYGPKLDFKLKDCMGRVWQCGTIQLDMNLPMRFGCYYIDKDGSKKQPIMLHRAMLGSIERFIGVITENFAGAFPTWCTPVQVKILPVNNNYHLDYCHKLYDKLKADKLRVELDDSEEKLGYRIRNSQMMKIPYTLVIGDNEVKDNTVTYRKYGSEKQITVSIDDFIKLINEEVESKALLVDPKKSVL
ncbi:MAG: threonine--tRNA ligase [Bacilli bacterium]|jgi:threonyl-tRNA synthetase